LIKDIKIKSFEKNPIKGGTPEIENKVIDSKVTKKKLNLRSLKEYNVLKL
jgi:hypothetical protein